MNSEPHTVVTPEQVAAESAAKPRVNIEAWAFTDMYGQWVNEPLNNFVTGFVKDHPRLKDNGTRRIRTSRVIVAVEGTGQIETHNTVYILGNADDEFAVWYYENVLTQEVVYLEEVIADA